MLRPTLAFAISVTLFAAASDPPVAPPVRAALDSIAAANLKGDLSFLSSDAMQGRFTPSPELDIAAEFIASKFRAAGLEPGGNQDYFQTAAMVSRRMPPLRSALRVYGTSSLILVPAAQIQLRDVSAAAQILRAPILVIAIDDADKLKTANLKGKVVMVAQPDADKLTDPQKTGLRAIHEAVASSNAVLEVRVVRRKAAAVQPRLLSTDQASRHGIPQISVANQRLWSLLTHSKTIPILSASVRLPAPEDLNVVLKNVIGILRGSDPVLKNTCVLLTAHYDHIGTGETAGRLAVGEPKADDRIYNGANDDGSGTVSVIEIARALARVNLHPSRSIVFITFFGEELGELGAQYYAKHPVFPAAKTVADLNLEQLGRTDSTVGKQVENATLTGYQYSDVTKFLEQAGRETGIKVYEDKEASEPYFLRSDNEALARLGIPAHTIAVAYDFPDYHAAGDEWQKIDYENMAKVDRMIGLAVVNLANSATAPEWNTENPKTAPFREARGNIQ
jgi:peptidase M28-like protein